MTEAAERTLVIAEARAWLGTPYHHRSCLKGVGVDCAQLPIGVWSNVGLIKPFDTGEYPSDWHLHRQEERYAGVVQRFAAEITAKDVRPGDLILFKFGRAFSHGAILVEPGVVVHAVRSDGCVTLGDLDRDAQLIDRPRRFFSFWARRSTPAQAGGPPAVAQRGDSSDGR